MDQHQSSLASSSYNLFPAKTIIATQQIFPIYQNAVLTTDHSSLSIKTYTSANPTLESEYPAINPLSIVVGTPA